MLMKLDFSNEHVWKLGPAVASMPFCWPSRAREITITELNAETNANAAQSQARREIPIHQQVADWIHIEGASHHSGPWDTLVITPHNKGRKAYRRYFHDVDSRRPQTRGFWRPADLYQLIHD